MSLKLESFVVRCIQNLLVGLVTIAYIGVLIGCLFTVVFVAAALYVLKGLRASDFLRSVRFCPDFGLSNAIQEDIDRKKRRETILAKGEIVRARAYATLDRAQEQRHRTDGPSDQ